MTNAGKQSSRKHGAAAGIFGLLTIASGVVATVLYYFFLQNYYENSIQNIGPQFDFWWTPVTFVVPGILGIAAALQRNKPLFAFYMAMAIMTLMVTGVFFIIIVVFVVTLPSEFSANECTTDGTECRCIRDLVDVYSQSTGYKDCDKMIQMVVYGHVATGLYAVAWVLCFAGSMLSCLTCCYIQKRRTRAMVAFRDRHCPSIRVSNVQPPGNRRTGVDNPSYVYF